MLIRYADDLVALCHTRQEAERSRRGSPRGWRPGVWRSTRTRRASSPSTRASTSWGSTSAATDGKLLIKPSKAAVRRIRERLRTELRSLRGANAAGGDQTAQPDHPGLGRLLPDAGLQRDLRRAGPLPVAAHLQVGQASATRTSRRPGSSAGTSASSTSPGRTGGCSATATAAPTCTSSPGPRSSDTRWSRARRHPTTPPWPTTGPRGGARNTPADRHDQPAAPRSPGRSLPDLRELAPAADDRPQTPREWEQWLAATRKAMTKQRHRHRRRTARRTRHDPSHTRSLPPATHAGKRRPGTSARHEPSGLA